MSERQGEVKVVDGCGHFGPTQKWAVVWFFSVIIIGATCAYHFCEIDRMMYDTNAEYYDYGAYRENRTAAASLHTDSIDPRSHGDLASVIHRKQQH